MEKCNRCGKDLTEGAFWHEDSKYCRHCCRMLELEDEREGQDDPYYEESED